MSIVSLNSHNSGRPTGGRVPGSDPIDIHVGKRIKLRRTLLRVSQEQLAGDVGVTFQQVQKYEAGGNRVSASRLFDISRTLNCPVAYFFEDIGPEVTDGRRTPASRGGNAAADEAEDIADPMQRTETLELVRAYWRLSTDALRRSVLTLLDQISRHESS